MQLYWSVPPFGDRLNHALNRKMALMPAEWQLLTSVSWATSAEAPPA